jgi:hypothetical protein
MDSLFQLIQPTRGLLCPFDYIRDLRMKSEEEIKKQRDRYSEKNH